MNGAVSYTYDAVGNRTQKVSTLPGTRAGCRTTIGNDQLATDTYDTNGNATASTGPATCQITINVCPTQNCYPPCIPRQILEQRAKPVLA